MGRAGDLRDVPLHRPSMGIAPAGGVVPARRTPSLPGAPPIFICPWSNARAASADHAARAAKLPKLNEVVARRRRVQATGTWHGGKTRRVELVVGEGQWFKAGDGLTPVRWVFVHDVQGTHRDEYFFTTDPRLHGSRIVSLFTARWAIETTFQEMRAHWGFETPRRRVAKSVLRTGPCLLGLLQPHLPDLRRTFAAASCPLACGRLVCQDRSDLLRRDRDGPEAVVVGNTFCRAGLRQWSHKTPASVQGRPAGLPQPGGVTRPKTARAELREARRITAPCRKQPVPGPIARWRRSPR